MRGENERLVNEWWRTRNEEQGMKKGSVIECSLANNPFLFFPFLRCLPDIKRRASYIIHHTSNPLIHVSYSVLHTSYSLIRRLLFCPTYHLPYTILHTTSSHSLYIRHLIYRLIYAI